MTSTVQLSAQVKRHSVPGRVAIQQGTSDGAISGVFKTAIKAYGHMAEDEDNGQAIKDTANG